MKVLIEIDRRNVVTSIDNNIPTEQYRTMDVKIGDKLSDEFIALIIMNPHRFQLSRKLED